MQNLIPINLVVGDRSYRIKIDAKDEETVRKSAKKLNDQLSQYKAQYAGKDMQDYLAMVLLAVVNEDTLKMPVEAPQTQEALERLENLLDRALAD